jgi:hypothetical protein
VRRSRLGLLAIAAVLAGAGCSTDSASPAPTSPPSTEFATGFEGWLRSEEPGDRFAVASGYFQAISDSLDRRDLAAAETAARGAFDELRWLAEQSEANDDGTRLAERTIVALDYCSETYAFAVDTLAVWRENRAKPLLNRVTECNRLLDVALAAAFE